MFAVLAMLLVAISWLLTIALLLLVVVAIARLLGIADLLLVWILISLVLLRGRVGRVAAVRVMTLVVLAMRRGIVALRRLLVGVVGRSLVCALS
jgi:hypothetical protein